MAMEQIHIKVIQEQSKKIVERVGKKNHLDHIYTAYVCSHVENFEAEYEKACLYYAKEQELKASGIALGDTVVGQHIQFMRDIGKYEFRCALYAAIVNEIKMRGHEIHNNWAFLAHMHIDAPNANEHLMQALGGLELETRMKKRGIETVLKPI